MDALQQLNLAAPLAATYSDIEEMLLCHIAEQLAGNPDMLINATSKWRILMLAQMGKLTKDTAKIITQKVGKVPADVSKVISAAISETLAENNIKVTDKTSENIIAALKNYDRQAIKSKYNQVNTVMQYKAKKAYTKGVNDVADRFERIMQKELDNKQNYLDVLNKNTLAAIVGEKSRTQALHDTICQMCDKGIPAFVDAAGREWSPEAYVNMDIRNTAKNAALAAQWQVMDELEQDVILVSSHKGARPLCADYQGKFYSRSGKSGTITDVNGKEYHYTPLSSTSFGKPAGLFGINCGHRMRGVSDGLFVNREKQYDEDENTEEYKKVCEQRRLERKIRSDKTKQNALKAVGDSDGAKALQAKITAENKQLKAYCNKNELTYRQDRTLVYGYSDPTKKVIKDDFVETVDKSAESGIIKAESNGVAFENQRYGRNKDTLVNKTYINSGEYRRKFDTISDNPELNKALYDKSKEALKHRSGTEFEDMYWFDADTGKVIASEINSTEKRKIVYSEKTKQIVANTKNVIALHTHPSSMPPSVSDFNSCYRNQYVSGYIPCHNGKIYGYSSEQEISKDLYNLYISSFIADGCDEFNAQLKTIEKLTENHLIKFWEVL